MLNNSPLFLFDRWLDSYLNFEHTPVKNIFWLDSMEFLCNRFNNPQNLKPCIHVAGSKGKGSVSKMISCILEAHGKKTGLYSSPHIIDFRERIQSSAGFFEDEVYEVSARELMNKVDSIKTNELPGERPLTWFELVTLYAFLCFKNAETDFNVFEVGLGGRLDATNVVKPLCSVITHLELEHTEFLGDTIEKIAFEKGGIIKQGIPCVIQSQEENARKVLMDIAREKNSDVYFTDEIGSIKDFHFENNESVFKICSGLFKRDLNIRLRMCGKFQAQNALTACVASKISRPEITEEEIEAGLYNAFLPGRFEVVSKNQTPEGIAALILDGAHTLKSEGFTMETLNSLFPQKDFRERHLLFACAKDKDVEDISSLFKDQFSRVTLTRPGDVKDSDMERMKKAFTASGIEYCACGDYVKACDLALSRAREENAVLLVTGSFYLVSEMKKFLISKKCSLIDIV